MISRPNWWKRTRSLKSLKCLLTFATRGSWYKGKGWLVMKAARQAEAIQLARTGQTREASHLHLHPTSAFAASSSISYSSSSLFYLYISLRLSAHPQPPSFQPSKTGVPVFEIYIGEPGEQSVGRSGLRSTTTYGEAFKKR